MKKTIIYLFMAISLLACSKEQPAEPVGEEKLTLDFSVSGGLEPETKGVKTKWANNDRLYIFFDQTVSENPEYLVIKYSNSLKNWIADSWTPGLESKIYHNASGTLTALYMRGEDFFFEKVQFFNIFLHLFRIGD